MRSHPSFAIKFCQLRIIVRKQRSKLFAVNIYLMRLNIPPYVCEGSSSLIFSAPGPSLKLMQRASDPLLVHSLNAHLLRIHNRGADQDI